MSNNLKPKIRFKGFTDTWEQRKLLSMAKTVGTGKSKYYISQYNKYPILGSRNVIGYDNDYDYSGDFILTARVGEYAGELYKYNGRAKITDNTVYIQGNNLNYLFYLLKNFDLKKLSFGSGQPLIKASELSNLELYVSLNNTEKDKISLLFSNIDNLITLHQRKYDKLVNIKKTLLEKMFPKNNSNIPEIRFKGFTDTWEQRKVEDCGEIITGNTPSSQNEEYYSADGALWVTPTDINSNTIKDTAKKLSPKGIEVARKLPKDSILVTCIASIGKNTMLEKAGSCNQQINAIIPNKKYYDSYFLLTESELWSNEMKRSAPIGTMQIINKVEFSELNSHFPKINEQIKISQLFRHLDNLITLHQRKHEKLVKIKQSLLRDMFV